MSTKTSIKRIALVAAAALTLGGFSAVSASADTYPTVAAATFTVTSAYAGQSTGFSSTANSTITPGTTVKTAASQTVGGLATIDFVETMTAATTGTKVWANITSSGVGVISAVGTGVSGVTATVAQANVTAKAQGSTTTAPTFPTTSLSLVAVYAATTEVILDMPIVLSSATAGTQTLTATYLNTDGSVLGTKTATVTWGATSTAGISTANSYIYTTSASGCATTFSTLGAAQTDNVSFGQTSGYYIAGAARVCLATFDGSGNAITPVAVKFFGIGVAIQGTSAGSGNANYGVLGGDSANKGSVTLTAYATDAYGNTSTFTAPFLWYGKVAKVVLANDVYADHASSTSTGSNYKAVLALNALTDSTGLHTIAVSLQDSAGNVIPKSAWGTVTNDIGVSTLGVVSDKGNGNTSTGLKGQSNSYATITYDATGYDGAGQGKSWGGFNIACSQSAKYEHLKITAYGYNSVTGNDDIASNTVDFYCSGLASSVVVSAAATADAGAALPVNATVTDSNGYPVADGTAINFGASNGGTFLGGDLSTTAGTQVNPANLIVGSQGDNVITALVQGATPITATSTVSVSGGVAGTSSLSLDAANAATDAANNAYDEAQNATQAASDALAAVTALSAQVGALIATVKSLAAVVAKIKAKVKA